MADVDASIIIGSQPDEASARKTGEALGRAAGAAANSAFLASFNAIFDKIPVSNKAVKGSVSMPVKAREHLNQLLGVAGGSPIGSAEGNAALKHLIGALREYDRKGNLSVDQQLAVSSAISGGQDAIRLGNRLRRQAENAAFSQDKKQATTMDAYARAVMLFGASAGDLQGALKTGDKDLIKLARQRHAQHASAIMSDRFADVVTPKDLEKARQALLDNARATKQAALNSMILSGAVSGIASVMGAAASILPSMWGQHVTRNLFSARTAYNERVTAGGQAAGGVIGGVLGAAIGGALTSGMGGQIVGAQIGSSIGSLTGGLIGKSRQAEWESQQKSISDVQARFKALGLYRGAYSPTFGAAVGELGQASASDVEGMVGNSQTLAARMMFGQVSDNEMLLYSLMPNYFAAAMAGASDAELAAAYTRDLNALDPSLRLWVGSMVGGGSAGMVAFSQDKYSGGVLSRGSWYHGTDHVLVSYGGSYQAGSVERGALNAHAMEGQVRADLNKAAKAEASGTMEGIYSRVAPVPQMIMANGEMVSTNSKEYQDMVEAGVIGDPGKASGVRAFLQRNLNYVGIPTGWLGARVDTKENMSIEAFESAAYAAQSGKKGKLAELDAQEEEWRKRHVTVVINNQIDGDTVSQKVIDIMGDETAVSNEISRFNLGGR